MKNLLFVFLAVATATRPAFADDKWDATAHEIYRQLIEIDTTHSTGDTTRAAKAMAARLKAAGFPAKDVRVLGPSAKRGNLVARMRGTGTGGRKPLLLLAHLDVVEARKEDWSVDPFKLTEKDGFFYGRGTRDDKAMAAIWIATLIRLKKEGWKPDRDLIVALTADEEGGLENGVDWLLANHRPLIDAELCLNEGGGGQSKGGKYLLNQVQATEKVYQSFRLEVKNRGGHSSQPTRENAIYRLSAGLVRLSAFEFPVKLNEVTRGFFARSAALETGQVAADMKAVTRATPDAEAARRLSATAYYNAQLRTTCVATTLDGGHADNALPQTARAGVNCRLLPGESMEAVKATLVKVLADDEIALSLIEDAPSAPGPASPLAPEVMGPIERITGEMWPGLPVVPTMSTGATDGRYLRSAGIPTYGVSGLFEDIDDNRAHGKDERMGVKQFHEGQEFLLRLVKTMAGPVTK